jgi:hypothetical protein
VQIYFPVSTLSKFRQNNMKFLAIMMETVIGAAILKSVLFTLLYKMFRLPPINGHSINKQDAEIHFHLTKARRGQGGYQICYP